MDAVLEPEWATNWVELLAALTGDKTAVSSVSIEVEYLVQMTVGHMAASKAASLATRTAV
jgi:hypothetical protein